MRSDNSSPPVAAASSRFPAGIPYIVGNEGAERFSFYGMRQILYIYLTALFIGMVAENAVAPEVLSAAKIRATQVTHLFMAGVYLFPMIGAILADRLLGKYRVILWVSLIYCAGHATMAIGGHLGMIGEIPQAIGFIFASLILISVGSGGIKPCVSANVGDQFTKENSHLVSKVFQIFYFIINFGSFFASLLTPWIYKHHGPDWAFGLPGILMGVATLVFWLGRKRFVKVPPKPGGMLGFLDFLSSTLMLTPLLVIVGVGATVAEELVHAAMSDQAGAVAQALTHIAASYWPYAVGALFGFAAGVALFILRQSKQQDTGFFAIIHYCWKRRTERQAGDDFWSPARKSFGEEIAEGPMAVIRIIIVFSMISVFWALFDQHSSTWVEQAKAMQLSLTVPSFFWYKFLVPTVIASALFGAVWLFLWVSNRTLPKKGIYAFVGLLGLWGIISAIVQLREGGSDTIQLLPAQIAALNPLLVMMIIPLLNAVLYKPMEKRGTPLKPLARMTIGLFMASLAFVSVAMLQARIEAAPANSIHVLWQLIPYFILTMSEVFVSVTGLEFAYTQAPRAMKSTIMGFWLLCVTFGNILVAFLAPLQTLSLSTFFWTFAGLMAVAALIFVALASGYKGKTYLQS